MSDGSTTPARPNRQFNEAFAVGWNARPRRRVRVRVHVEDGREPHRRPAGRAGPGRLRRPAGHGRRHRRGAHVPADRPGRRRCTGLHVKAGPQVFDGTTAVQFARARHDIGDGSDTGRITRQHDLMAAMSRSVLSARRADRPRRRCSRFAQAATSSLTASSGFRRPHGPHRVRAVAAPPAGGPDRVRVDADGGRRGRTRTGWRPRPPPPSCGRGSPPTSRWARRRPRRSRRGRPRQHAGPAGRDPVDAAGRRPDVGGRRGRLRLSGRTRPGAVARPDRHPASGSSAREVRRERVEDAAEALLALLPSSLPSR